MLVVCITLLIIIVPFIILEVISTNELNKSLDAYEKAERELNNALAEYIKFKMDKGDF